MADSKPKPTNNGTKKAPSWTILLFIAADGNLANFAVESLKQVNNSLATHAADTDSKVVVAAQFAIDAPGGQQIPRYVFDEHCGGSIGDSLDSYLNAPDDMTEQQALISFLQWAFKTCDTEKYALILWGHGPELLLQPPSDQEANDPCVDLQNGGQKLYLTPEELRIALEQGVPDDKRVSIVGFDACSMSMLEAAYEIRECADYMVASQEEIPDPSFPYDTLVELFRKKGSDEETLLRDGVYAYVDAYQDYICNVHTGMKRVTLTALRLNRLNQSDPLTSSLHQLACALWAARKDQSLFPLLVEARKCSRDFAGGLYVDLYDFCEKLSRILSAREPKYPSNGFGIQASGENGKYERPGAPERARRVKIKEACDDVMKAFVAGNSPQDLIVLANDSFDTTCHGISLYLPYFTDQQNTVVSQPLVKGGPDTIGKGFSAVVNRGASSLLMCVRRQLILETEGYYEGLKLAHDTGWYCFIAKQWSKILTTLAPERLDCLYSAQQSAENANKRCKRCDTLEPAASLSSDSDAEATTPRPPTSTGKQEKTSLVNK